MQIQPNTPEIYVIVKGDTLWDLSQKFLNNPWYWPKIWSLNAYIENPHWIYPGNKLKIIPGQGGPQAPAQVEQAPEPMNEERPQSEIANQVDTTPPEAADLAVVRKGSREFDQSSTAVSVSGKLAFKPPAVLSVRDSGLVSPEEMRMAGSLDASFEEKDMLATFDTGYVRFKRDAEINVGDRLILFRPDGDIVQPVTQKPIGTFVQVGAVDSTSGCSSPTIDYPLVAPGPSPNDSLTLLYATTTTSSVLAPPAMPVAGENGSGSVITGQCHTSGPTELRFTLTGAMPSRTLTMFVTPSGSSAVSVGTVTTDGAGNATFASYLPHCFGNLGASSTLSLTVDGNPPGAGNVAYQSTLVRNDIPVC